MEKYKIYVSSHTRVFKSKKDAINFTIACLDLGLQSEISVSNIEDGE